MTPPQPKVKTASATYIPGELVHRLGQPVLRSPAWLWAFLQAGDGLAAAYHEFMVRLLSEWLAARTETLEAVLRCRGDCDSR